MGVLAEEEIGDSVSNVKVLTNCFFPTLDSKKKHLTNLLHPPLSQPPLASPLLLRPLRRTPRILVSGLSRASSGEPPLHGDRRSRSSETSLDLSPFFTALRELRMERPLTEQWRTAGQR